MTLPAPQEKRRFVEHMFDLIAPRYELMNHLMTFGLDRSWRRETVAALGLKPGARVVDLGCGTGDLAAALAAAGAAALGVDLSAGMLGNARRRLPGGWFARADAEQLPLRDGSCDGVVSGFALRNFLSVPAVLVEVARVLRPAGRLALLEVDVPSPALMRFGFNIYFRGVVPALGRLVSRGYAYEYLAQSLAYLPAAGDLERMLEGAGFVRINKRRFMAGAAQLVTAARG